MQQRENAWLRHQQKRWLRPDGDRFVRPDAARYLKPGADPADVFPALAFKYSPNQRRVPAGNPDGGQWTSDGGGGAALDPAAAPDPSRPTGDIDIGDASGIGEGLGLFQITPATTDRSGVQLAGDPPEGLGNGLGEPSEQPPEIPEGRPNRQVDRMRYMRSAASWLGRMTGLGLPIDIYLGAMNNVEWLDDYRAVIETYRDPPKTLEELQAGVGLGRRGYDDHHIVEQTWAERFGFSRSEIDDPSNLVSIPRMKHWDITGWYMTKNDRFGGLSPREYLSGKDWDERYRVGIEALIDFGILKP